MSVAVDPTGKFVYVANEGSTNVSGYTLNATTGALTAISGSPFAAGLVPFSVAVDPTGKFAYVANEGSNDVSGFTINATTGALTAISGSPFAAGSNPVSVAVDPTGKFAYVANFSNNVSAYTINASTGALTAISGSPFAAGFTPHSVTVDPAGKFAYVANNLSNNISGYTINATTGALTAITGSPFAAGRGPISVTVGRSCSAPVISGSSATPDVLWPPNKKFVDVSIGYSGTSNCPAACTLSVTSNEPADRGSDWIIVDAKHVELRAERDGKGPGRIYTITITCTNDTNQKSSAKEVRVLLRHDQMN